MAKPISCFSDSAGKAWPTPQAAVQSDIALALGRRGDGGQAEGLASLVMENRQAVEQAFRDLDLLIEQFPEHKKPTATNAPGVVGKEGQSALG